jgi:hypothetical protein
MLFIPKAKEARTIPFGACDSEGDLGQAVISLAVPGKAVSHHHHALRLTIPLPDQDRPRRKPGPFLVKGCQTGGHRRFGFLRNPSIKHLPGRVVEIAKALGLGTIGREISAALPQTGHDP